MTCQPPRDHDLRMLQLLTRQPRPQSAHPKRYHQLANLRSLARDRRIRAEREHANPYEEQGEEHPPTPTSSSPPPNPQTTED